MSPVAILKLLKAAKEIKDYVKKPNTVLWSGVEINGKVLYNASASVDFELHSSEENALIVKILSLINK